MRPPQVTVVSRTPIELGDGRRIQLPKVLLDHLFYLSRVLSGSVSYGQSLTNHSNEQNIDCWKVSGTTPGVANTEFSVAHGLGRVPLGFQILSVNAAAHVYQSTTAWTATTIFLKSDQPSVAYVLAII